MDLTRSPQKTSDKWQRCSTSLAGLSLLSLGQGFDPRGSLDLLVQMGFAYCGRILYTPLHVSPAD